MDAKTLKALKASIEKWERNAEAGTIDDYKLGCVSCPLCRVFHPRYTDKNNECAGCPVADAGFSFCEGTPYDAASAAYSHWHYNDGLETARAQAHDAALKEVAFLKSLLPAEESA
jgi:hypothetical protein